MNQPQTQQIVKAAAKRDIREYIQSAAVLSQMAMVLPKHLTAERMARVACTAVIAKPELLNCTQESLLQALMLCSQAGLEPDGRRCHLIPFGKTVQALFDWKGLVEIAGRNGVQVTAKLVYDADEFSLDEDDGSGATRIHHKVNVRGPRGEVIGAYSRAVYNGGPVDYEWMSTEEIEYTRRTFSRAANSDAWVKSWGEMARKTVIHRHSKRWPLSSEQAQALDREVSGIAELKSANAEQEAPEPTPEPKRPKSKQAAPTTDAEFTAEVEKHEAPVFTPSQTKLAALLDKEAIPFVRFQTYANSLPAYSGVAMEWPDLYAVPDQACQRVLMSETTAVQAMREGLL